MCVDIIGGLLEIVIAQGMQRHFPRSVYNQRMMVNVNITPAAYQVGIKGNFVFYKFHINLIELNDSEQLP